MPMRLPVTYMQGLRDFTLSPDFRVHVKQRGLFCFCGRLLDICTESEGCGWAQVSCVSSAGAVTVFLLIFAFCKYKKLF